LGANAPSFVLVLEVEPTIDGEHEILYEGIYQGDDVDVLMWFIEPILGHYQWLHGPLFQIFIDYKVKLFAHTIRCILRFLQIK
jgi:hypothetical protein